MSMDKGLKPRDALARHRNVLTRDERVAALKDVEKWTEEMGVLGLPKVAHRKMATKKTKDETAAATAEGAVAAGAEGAAPAAAAPVAAAEPAKGDKKADKKADKKK
jgi:small basic protein (TIGR04137 family)